MVLAAGTNCLTIAEDALRLMLAASPAFQSWVTEFDALHVPADHIHTTFCPLPGFVLGAGPRADVYTLAELNALGRYALLGTFYAGSANTFTIDSVSHAYEHLPAGELWVQFTDVVDPVTHILNEKMREFMNAVGDIVEEVLALAGTGAYLSIKSIAIIGAGVVSEDYYPTHYEELAAKCLVHYDSQG